MISRLAMFQKVNSSVKYRRLLPVSIWIWMVVTAATAGFVDAQEPEIVDRIVAVVNSDIITLYDLNRAFRPYEANIKALKYSADKERQTLYQVRSDVLNKLIESQLADQQTKLAQITVSQKEIDTTIERLKEARSFTDEQLREGLAAQGITMEEYRKEIESQILRTKLVNREIKSKIVITESDINTYYDSHQEKYAGDKKYYLWNLFIKASEIDKDRGLQEMKRVALKLKQDSSFESLVTELNESSSAVKGTDLGLYRRDELSEELREVVTNLKSDEFSEILETNFGFQIIYVQEIQDTEAKPLEDVEAEIQQILYDELVDNKYQDWLKELRARSHIRIIN
jgi:peptidyl-prolyl cis-trans isomerase SurA